MVKATSVNQLVRELGCLDKEAELALESHPEVSDAREVIKSELAYRRRKFAPALTKIWQKYTKDDNTNFDQTIALLTDLDVEPEDEVVLALVYELGAPSVGVFNQQKYIDGWGRLGCSTLAHMKTATKKLATMMRSESSYFARVYRNTFKYNLEPGHRFLDAETAVGYWQLLLLPRFPTLTDVINKWCTFIEKDGKVSFDNWNMFLEFCEYAKIDPTFSSYDDTASWPITIDEFIESLQAERAQQ